MLRTAPPLLKKLTTLIQEGSVLDPFITEAKDLAGMVNNDTRAPRQAVPNAPAINFQRIHLLYVKGSKLHLEVFEMKYTVPTRESGRNDRLYAVLSQFSDCTSFRRLGFT